ncbi:MAG: helix-turn-helix transcriptional regulator [Bacteroidetes bacterium]|nr:helix-turn-helix transcriptional regulator [Bacteroidota bacterium]
MIDTTKLKQLLEEKDLTTQQLCVLSKLSLSTIRHILKGKSKNPDKDTVKKIAIALQVTIDEITK